MRARSFTVLSLFVLAACGDSGEIVREVTTGIRTTSRVEVSVKASAEEPTAADIEVRRKIEDRIEQENIGRLISSGAAAGYSQVTVEVENTAEAIPRIQDILRSMDLDRDAKFRVIVKED